MTIKLPSLLSFERKLEISDALMYSGNWGEDPAQVNDWETIPISKRQNRSTQSAYGIDDAKKSEPNPVSSDSDDANLPSDKDTLKISFTLRVIGNLGVPFACNEPDFEKLIKEKVKVYKDGDEQGFNELAFRYAYNIANGRFLWRNRVGAEDVIIRIRHNDESLVFNAYDFSLNDFKKNNSDEDLLKLTKILKLGFKSVDDFVFITVDAYVKLGCGQHVFPSQEMNMNEKGKVLFQLNKCAAMHNVKIGNAIRTIDNWYGNAEFPIAAEPYGSVTQRGQAYRKNKNDLYTLMVAWVNENKETSEAKRLSINDKSYVISNLIRGGVFSGGSKKKK